MFAIEIDLIKKVFKDLKLTPIFEVRPQNLPNLRADQYYLHINCREYHSIMLRIQNGYFFSHNVPALKLRKVVLPLTEGKLNELKRKLNALKETHRKLARTNIKKFMEILLSWTTVPNNQKAMASLLTYKKIVAKYNKHEGDVFRGIVLTDEEYKALKSGKIHSYNLPSSWANNLRTAKRYAKGYSNSRLISAGSRVGVVFKVRSPKVIFNVPAFVKANPNVVVLAEANIYNSKLEAGSLYEAEIILAPITLTYKDVVWTKKY